MSKQYIEFSVAVKMKNLVFAQIIDCWYIFETPYRGGSNEFPQSILFDPKTNFSTSRFYFKIGVQGGIHVHYTDKLSCDA